MKTMTIPMTVPMIENVACGYESFINETEYVVKTERELRRILRAKKPLLIKVSGESMLPKFNPNDIILTDMSLNELCNGNVVAVSHNNVGMLKVFQSAVNTITLFSYNEAYKPIIINKYDEFQIISRYICMFKRSAIQ